MIERLLSPRNTDIPKIPTAFRAVAGVPVCFGSVSTPLALVRIDRAIQVRVVF